VFLGGIAVLGIGYSLFSITIFREGYYRTLFYGLPGAAAAVAILIWVLSHIQSISRAVFVVLCFAIAIIYLLHTERLSACLLVAGGIGFLLNPKWNFTLIGACLVGYTGAAMMGYHTQQPFADLPARQQRLATSIATQAPAIKSKSLILLTTDSNTITQYESIRNRYDIFESMMQFVYKRYDIEAQLCNIDGMPVGDLSAICVFERDAIVIKFINGKERWTYDRVIAFNYDPDKGLYC